jgi:hypothetical protein
MINIIEGWSKYLLNEFKITEPSKLSIDRLDICNNCDSRSNDMCKECGCYIPAKTLVKNEHCPLNKWQQQA